jgi:mannose-6-phosphate isomerase-like protein (cupin superfamily)
MSKQARMSMIFTVALLLLPASSRLAYAVEGNASDLQPLSFGADQRIIDLSRVHWGPLTGDRITPGAQVAVLRGSLKSGPVEVVIRLPANYTLPVHSHTSDETYVWISGRFTYVAEDGTAVELPDRTFIGLPPSTPHGLTCGSEPCLLYVRYSNTFDMKSYPMPKLKPAAVSKAD